MKPYLLVLSLLVFSMQNFAQEAPAPKIKEGIDLNFFISSFPHQDGFEFNPDFLITYKKSVFRLGPLINLSSHSDGYYSSDKTFNGVAFAYQIFPNGIQNRFDFFFQYDLAYYTNEFTEDYSYYGGKQTISVHSTNMHIGYGFRFNVDKRIYIMSSFGFGYRWYHENYPPYYYYYYDRDDYSTSGILHICLGIKF